MFIGKIDGRQTCVTLGWPAIFCCRIIAGMHGVAAMVVTMVDLSSSVSFSNVRWAGKRRYAGSSHQAGELVFLLALL
ncbi:hypothetical protein ACNKHW_12675 [Shigella flexneri]